MKRKMKKKTAIRWLVRNEFKMARFQAIGFGIPRWFSKRWNLCVRIALSNK